MTEPAATATPVWHEQLRDAVATLTPSRRPGGALWLAAPVAHAARIAQPRLRQLAIADAAPLVVPVTNDPAHLAEWAVGVWAGTPGPRRELGDVTTWVDFEHSGARVVARGSRTLWGRRFCADPTVTPAVLRTALELLATGELAAGVLNGALVSITRTSVLVS